HDHRERRVSATSRTGHVAGPPRGPRAGRASGGRRAQPGDHPSPPTRRDTPLGGRPGRARAFCGRGVDPSHYLPRITNNLEQTLAPAGDSALSIGGKTFRSRLMVGTGKYRDNAEMVRAISASDAEIVTVAVRRVDLDRRKEESLLHHLNPDRYF